MIRTSAFLCCSIAAGALLAAASPASTSAVDPNESVDFETLGIVADTAPINLSRPQLLRISDAAEYDEVSELLGAGTGESSFPDDVMAAVSELQPDRVVLIGIIDESCTPASVAGLQRTLGGDLVMTAPGHAPEPIECFVANTTVAVLSVAAEDAPPGSTDHADLATMPFSYGCGSPDLGVAGS